MFQVALPVPPTDNNLFPTNKQGRRFISSAYKAWKESASYFLKRPIYPIEGPVKVKYEYIFPDKKRRDLTNFTKSIGDFLVQRGVLIDDSQIDHVELIRHPIGTKSAVLVTVQRMNNSGGSV